MGRFGLAILALLALFIYDRGAPPGLLTGPPTTNLTAQAASDSWTTPRGGASAAASVADAGVTIQGIERWRTDIGSEITSSPTVGDGRVYVTTQDRRIMAFSADDGSLLWERPGPGPMDAAPIIAGDRLFVAFRNSTMGAFDAATGDVIWEARISNPLYSWLNVYGGSVYVSAQNGVIQAFDAGNGVKRWEIDTQGGMSAAPAVSEGMLIVPMQDRQVLVLVGETGQTRLSYVVPGVVEGGAAISHGTAVLGDTRGYVHALDIRAQNLPLEKTVLRFWAQFAIWGLAPFPPAQSGSQWTQNTGGQIWQDAAIASNRAYVVTRSGNVHAYNLGGGRELWTTALSDEDVEPGPPIIVNNVMYAGTEAGQLHAIDANSGDHLWSYSLGDAMSSAPAYAAGSLYLLTDNGTLIAVD